MSPPGRSPDAGIGERERRAESRSAEERQKRRDCKVVRDRGSDARGLHEHRDEDEAEVVVVHLPAREPGIERREVRALQHRVEIREVHRLLAATRRMPEVGIGPTDQDPGREQGPEEPLCDQEQPPVRSQPCPELAVAACRRSLHRQAAKTSAERAMLPRVKSTIRRLASHQTSQVTKQQPDRPREREAAVRERRPGEPCVRQADQPQYHQRDHPEEHRVTGRERRRSRTCGAMCRGQPSTRARRPRASACPIRFGP